MNTQNIYVMLTNDKADEFQPKIVEFLGSNLETIKESANFKVKFIFNPSHIIEHKLPDFSQKDFIIWHPVVASNNMDILKRYQHSIVVLQKKTILVQKISKHNPITENMAINNEFKIMYIDPNDNDITNEEWQLVIHENHYMITIEKLLNLITNGTKIST